ncbi:hypothetical protein [Rufibacter sp. LB8]|uniref:hypothetical protein n=1 Tax=Rufibacter sp. LB8 TaxID=2777781 RepID=UPI00178C6F51|nr:hypothetical protein [Rufibacter sp. LB8]
MKLPFVAALSNTLGNAFCLALFLVFSLASGQVLAQGIIKGNLAVSLHKSSTNTVVVIKYHILRDTVVSDLSPTLLNFTDQGTLVLVNEKNTPISLRKKNDSVLVSYVKPVNSAIAIDKFGKMVATVSTSQFVLEYKGVPLAIQNFKGTFKDLATTVEWTTANENGNDFFVLQKGDGKVFREVSRVTAAGFSSGQHKYRLTDPISGQNEVDYYRLKVVEVTGRYYYSSVISVAREGSLKSYLGFTIAIDEKPRFLLALSASGQVLGSYQLESQALPEIPGSMKGTVLFRLITDRKAYTKKLYVTD